MNLRASQLIAERSVIFGMIPLRDDPLRRQHHTAVVFGYDAARDGYYVVPLTTHDPRTGLPPWRCLLRDWRGAGLDRVTVARDYVTFVRRADIMTWRGLLSDQDSARLHAFLVARLPWKEQSRLPLAQLLPPGAAARPPLPPRQGQHGVPAPASTRS
jgi:hypothetical protein